VEHPIEGATICAYTGSVLDLVMPFPWVPFRLRFVFAKGTDFSPRRQVVHAHVGFGAHKPFSPLQ
jgi:hypothetical protein